jgi:hypothetical protein
VPIPLFVLTWIGLSLCAAYFGRERAVGFWGTFLLAVICSPPVILVALIFLAHRRDSHPHPH